MGLKTTYFGTADAFQASTTLANGAILVDDYDRVIFDEVFRKFVVWNRIDKRPAPGDFTNGFDQTAVGNARVADKRAMSYSATSPTRAARTAREIKAIVRDLTFGLYDRSAYAQQGNRFGDLTAKDVSDIYTSIMRMWSDKFYNGSVSGDPLEFDGIKTILGSGTTLGATTSIVKTLQARVVTMTNSTARDVMPTAILCNARVRQLIAQEYRKDGDKLPTTSFDGTKDEEIGAIDTAVGNLPLIVDNWNSVVSGTPDTYPTFILSMDKISWQYIEPLGQAGPDPKLFEIALTNAIDQQYKGVLFGAVDLLGGTNHHFRYNIEDRSTVVSPTA